jgi:hypothetical protein
MRDGSSAIRFASAKNGSIGRLTCPSRRRIQRRSCSTAALAAQATSCSSPPSSRDGPPVVESGRWISQHLFTPASPAYRNPLRAALKPAAPRFSHLVIFDSSNELVTHGNLRSWWGDSSPSGVKSSEPHRCDVASILFQSRRKSTCKRCSVKVGSKIGSFQNRRKK